METKKGNSVLANAIGDIEENDDRYYILIDSAYDNPEVLHEIKRIKSLAENKSNVIVIDDFICFEFIILEFKLLIDWVYDKNNKLLYKRKNVIGLRDRFVEFIINSNEDVKVLDDINAKAKTTLNYERMSSFLLSEITNNSGFIVGKRTLGKCWYEDCCNSKRMLSRVNKCGLIENNIDVKNRMLFFYDNSIVKDSFEKHGVLND